MSNPAFQQKGKISVATTPDRSKQSAGIYHKYNQSKSSL